MSIKSAQAATFTFQDNNRPKAYLEGVFKKYIYHWPLFVIGLSFAMALLYSYLRFVKPVYEIKATLLIQDQKKTPNQQSALSEIDIISSYKLIENEIEVFKSKQLVSKVVKDLDLAITYKEKDKFLYNDLYKKTPVQLRIIRPETEIEESIIDIIIKDSDSFFKILSDGSLKEQSFKTSIGKFKLDPTGNVNEYKGKTIRITVSDPEQVALQYQKAINANIPNKLATAVVLSVEDEVPQRGKEVLNKLISNYNLAASEGKIRQAKSTLAFLDQRIDSLTRELMQAEKGIENYKSERGLTDISNDTKISLENMQANDAKLNEVNVQLNVINGIEKYVNSAQNSGEIPTTFGIADPSLTGLVDNLSDLQLQRDRLLATTPEANPKFEAINRQLATTKAAIKGNILNIKSSLVSTKQKLQSFNSGFKLSIKTIPTKEREYVSIKRQQAIKENLYNYLLQKREEVSVSYASILAEDRVVDQAYAGSPRKPNQAIAMVAALLLGMMLPAALVYRRGSGKITDIQEIKDFVTVPVISELSYDPKHRFMTANAVTTVTGEQFRSLRSRLFYLYGERKHGRTTLITSSLPGEGKSYVSSNLSATLAYSGRKTIILELDLRKPKITEAFNIQNDLPGISDFLTGNASLTDIIQNSGADPNLDLISCGAPIINPSELLEGSRLKELIAELRNLYDDIVVDSPPMRLVSDALILSRLTDITLYVIRQGDTEKVELSFINELASQNLMSEMHIVFNGIRRIKYGYGYDYSKYNYLTEDKKAYASIFSNFSERF